MFQFPDAIIVLRWVCRLIYACLLTYCTCLRKFSLKMGYYCCKKNWQEFCNVSYYICIYQVLKKKNNFKPWEFKRKYFRGFPRKTTELRVLGQLLYYPCRDNCWYCCILFFPHLSIKSNARVLVGSSLNRISSRLISFIYLNCWSILFIKA